MKWAAMTSQIESCWRMNVGTYWIDPTWQRQMNAGNRWAILIRILKSASFQSGTIPTVNETEKIPKENAI